MAGDQPPPLVAALRMTPAGEREANPPLPQRGSRRRAKKSRDRGAHEWDRSSGKPRRMRSLRLERRQMRWMLLGGAALFALIVAGVLIATRSKAVAVSRVAVTAPSGAPAAVSPAVAGRDELAFLAEAKPLTRKFLAATRIEDLLPLVRHPEVTEARMRSYYPSGAIEPPGLAEFNTGSAVIRTGAICSLKVHTSSFEEKSIAFVDSKRGLAIDWESWVGWSAMTWDEFLTTKPTTPRVFRVGIKPVDYYNFDFADDRKWQAYGIISPDGGHTIYGYAERGSAVSARLPRPDDTQPDSPQTAFILALKFPPHANSANQVLIEQCVAEGWVLETDPPP